MSHTKVKLSNNKESNKLATKENDTPTNPKRPRGKWVTAIAYELNGVESHKKFGSVIVRGVPPDNEAKSLLWCERKVIENGEGLHGEDELVFLQLATNSIKVY